MIERLSSDELTALEDRIKDIRERVERAALRAGRRPENIVLLAATKTVAPEIINHAIDCGITHIGENRVQEYLGKRDRLRLKDTSVHFIGHLQTNKVRQIVGKVELIQSVDSVRLAEQISKQSCKLNMVSDILIEVNIENEKSKYGFNANELERALEEISAFEGVKVKGLMTIPPIFHDKEQSRAVFFNMFKLFIDMKEKKIDNVSMDILSMGMSGDFEEAILEGSTLIRLGSALFGARKYKED